MNELPIAYRLSELPRGFQVAGTAAAPPGLLTCSRALAGMQKEAVVIDAANGTGWRLLCDEGPWLNGTDLAPFPLGYFAAGLASCLLADFAAEFAARSLPVTGLGLGLELLFTMEGSILRDTMAAGVDAVRLTPRADSAVGSSTLLDAVGTMLAERSAVNRALAAHLPSRFGLTVNGSRVEWPGEPVRTFDQAGDPADLFAHLPGAADPQADEPVIHKDRPGQAAAPGGAVGLHSEQKRTVQIAADARLLPDGLQEIGAQCIHPAGSRFMFLATGETGDGRAPHGMAYLSAGIAFCFMTQLGRYAHIRKLPLTEYRIVQHTCFNARRPSPVETAVFLGCDSPVEDNQRMVIMSERTCYVHTTLREPVRVSVTIGPDA